MSNVRQVSGTARVVRGDKGTENTNVATIQRYFRSLQDDSYSGDNSFKFGKSTSNLGGANCGEAVQIGGFAISKIFNIVAYFVMKILFMLSV